MSVKSQVDEQFPIDRMDVFEKFLDDKEGWKVNKVIEDSKTTISTKEVDKKFWSKITSEKLPFNIKDLFEIFIDTNIRDKISDRLKDTRVIEREEFFDVLSFRLATPIGITDREILQARRWRYLDGKSIDSGFFAVLQSVDLKQFPIKKKPIRAICTMVRRFMPNKDGTSSIQSVSQYEFGGWIPTKIVNMLIGKMSETVTDKTKAAIEYLKKKRLDQKK